MNKRSCHRAISVLRPRLLSTAVAACFAAPAAFALPTGPQVVVGSAAFSQQTGALTVTNTPGTVINWQGFSIGASEATRFVQQSAASSVLNRVVGAQASAILGALQSNGRVWLVNPNGILFGPSARIDVQGLVASTLAISNKDFLAGKLNFDAGALGGNGAGGIRNQGNITTREGGSVYLVAPDIENSGIIHSPKGEVMLAAGHKVSLVEAANPDVQMVLSAPTDKAVNLGKILVESGRGSLFGASLAQRGIVSANSVTTDAAGNIVFRAKKDVTLAAGSKTTADGAAGGTITVQADEGTNLVYGEVSAKASKGKGGTVQLLGERVGLVDSASVDVSGETGGGTVLIGGDYQGRNPAVQNATATYVSPDATIAADAKRRGDGGKVIVWGNDAARVHGSISARGGADGGDGGFVETSGHWLDVAGVRVDAGAPKGTAGTWLLDPSDVTILAGSGVESGGIFYGGIFDLFTAASATIYAGSIASTLYGGTDVSVNTASLYGGNGDITLAAYAGIAPDLTTNGARTLTFNAYGSILLDDGSSISATGDKLHVNLYSAQGPSGGAIVMNPGSSISSNGGNVTLAGGAGGTGSAVGISSNPAGITLNGAIILASGPSAGGAISLNGKGYDGTNNAYGIYLWGPSTIQTNYGGTITLTGQGGAGTSGNRGVYLSNASLSTVNGAISITGTGGNGTSSDNKGVEFNGPDPAIQVTGVGSVSIIGQGGSGSSSNYGVDSGKVVTTTGNVTITGTAGTGSSSDNHGIEVSDAIQTGSGNISLVGTGGTGTTSNKGIFWSSSSATLTSTSGNISITGYGGNGSGDSNRGVELGAALQTGATGTVTIIGQGGNGTSQNWGVRIGGPIVTAAGNVTITGAASSGSTLDSNYGIEVSDTITTGSGSIALVGTGGSGTDSNKGIVWGSSLANLSSDTGDISMTGTGGAGTGINNRGVELTASVQTAYGGDITVTGYGGGSGISTAYNFGVYVNYGAISSQDGSLSVTGYGGASGSNNYGVALYGPGGFASVGGSIQSTGGDIAVAGFGGGDGASNLGVLINGGMVSTVDGALSVVGHGGAGTSYGNSGIELYDALVSASGYGGVSLIGYGGDGTSDNYGVYIDGSTVSAVNGALSIFGYGGSGSSYDNKGIYLYNTSVFSTGTGSVSLAGYGGDGISQNYGVYIVLGSAVSVAYGGLSIVGYGGSGSGGVEGIRLSSSSVSATETGSVSLTGYAGDGGEAAGVEVDSLSSLSTNSGPTNIWGQGGSSDCCNVGVKLYGTVQSVSGDITVTGYGGGDGTGSWNSGVELGGVVNTGYGGTVTITGQGGSGTWSNFGVDVNGGTGSVVNGALNIIGYGGDGSGTTDENTGINLSFASFTATGTGSLSLAGYGGDGGEGSGVSAYYATVSTASGPLTIWGQGGATGDDNVGVNLDGMVLVQSGSGPVMLTGYGGGSTGSGNIGVSINGFYQQLSPTSVLSDSGSVTVTGMATSGTSSGLIIGGFERLGQITGGGTVSVSGVGQGGAPGLVLQGAYGGDASKIWSYYGGVNIAANSVSLIYGEIHAITALSVAPAGATTAMTIGASDSSRLSLTPGDLGRLFADSEMVFGSPTTTALTIANSSVLETLLLNEQTLRWLIKAANPSAVTKNGTTSDFRLYNNATAPPTGNGFIYASAPGVLSVDTTLASGTASNTFGTDPTAVFGYAFANASIADNEDLVLFAGSPSFTPTITGATDAGSYTVTYSSGFSSAAGYTFAAGTGLPYTVNPVPIVVVPVTGSLTGTAEKTYDGTFDATLTPENFLLEGFVNGNSATVTKTSGTYDSKNVGDGIRVSTTLGTGDFTPTTGTVLSNYTLPTSVSGNIGKITPAPLSITELQAKDKVYDGTRAATLGTVTFSKIFGSDVVTLGNEAAATFDNKNVGTDKPVSVIGLKLAGAQAGNYKLTSDTAETKANITVRPLSIWSGGSSGNWSDPANWDALPDLSNVAAVTVPAGTAVIYDAAAGNTSLFSLTAGELSLTGGSLSVSNSLIVDSNFSQTGGTLSLGGGASASVGGTASITQPIGDLAMSLPLTAPQINLSAPTGTITQSVPIVTAALNTQSLSGTTLDNPGNQIGSFEAVNSGSGNVTLTNSGGPLVIAGISNPGRGVVINNMAGAITQSGAIFAASLNTQSQLGTTLNSASNQVGSFGAVNGGGGSVSLTNAVASLGITGISNEGGGVTLNNTGAITQSGPIVAASLSTQSQSGTTLDGAGNQVSSFAAVNVGSGSVTLNNGGPLDVTGISNPGDIAVNNTGPVTVIGTGTVSDNGNTTLTGSALILNAAVKVDGAVSVHAQSGGISGPGVITAGSIELASAGGIGTSESAPLYTWTPLLSSATALSGIYIDNHNPAILNQSGQLTVGTVTGSSVWIANYGPTTYNGVVTVNGPVSLIAFSPLTISATGSVNATGNVSLQATSPGLLTIDGPVSSQQGWVNLLGGSIAINANVSSGSNANPAIQAIASDGSLTVSPSANLGASPPAGILLRASQGAVGFSSSSFPPGVTVLIDDNRPPPVTETKTAADEAQNDVVATILTTTTDGTVKSSVPPESTGGTTSSSGDSDGTSSGSGDDEEKKKQQQQTQTSTGQGTTTNAKPKNYCN